MPHDLMYRCEQKKIFHKDGGYEDRWVEVSATTLTGVASNKIRCVHCHGAVRVHKQQVEHGPRDHVEHRLRQDSEGCRAGMHFKGNHQISRQPVL